MLSRTLLCASLLTMSGCVGDDRRETSVCAPTRHPRINEAPARIQELAKAIVGKKGDDVRDIIIKRFGPADRDIGSGFRIEQWDIESGVLTFHPACGPTFLPKGGEMIRLLPTTNKALQNLVGSFEMFTLPDPDNRGTKYWLGNVHLNEDGTYAYVDSGSNKEQRTAQMGNFFMSHPTGRYQIRFAVGCTGETLLESLPDRTLLCHIAFSPGDGRSMQVFSITSYSFGMRLVFGSDRVLSFDMDKSWDKFWD